MFKLTKMSLAALLALAVAGPLPGCAATAPAHAADGYSRFCNGRPFK